MQNVFYFYNNIVIGSFMAYRVYSLH